MRKWYSLILLAGLWGCFAYGGTVAVKGTPNTPKLQWLANHFKKVRGLWGENGHAFVSQTQFVVGNKVWQPGAAYRNGSDWLGLSCEVGKCELLPATLTVKKEQWQGHYDDEPTNGQMLMFMLQSLRKGKTIAWFHTKTSVAWLSERPVATYYYAGSGNLARPESEGTLEASVPLPKGDSATLVPLLLMGQTNAELSKITGEYDPSPSVLLQLRVAGKRQLLLGDLGGCNGQTSPGQYLLWAGDLDEDQLPDYLISFVDEDGPVHLYLSSLAKADELVGLSSIYDAPPFGGECDSGGWWYVEGR